MIRKDEDTDHFVREFMDRIIPNWIIYGMFVFGITCLIFAWII